MTVPAQGSHLGLEDVSGSYIGPRVLHEVTIRVEPGEVCAVLGPNGAGKSSLLRAVMGLMPHATGRIRHADDDIAGLPTHLRARRGIAYVPEGRGILNSLTVLDNLRLGARLVTAQRGGSKEVAARIAEVIERFPTLRDRMHQRAGTLSGGEQQMLALARALVGGPSVLLSDEPSLGLAPRVRHALGDLLREIAQRDRLAVLLAEQDVSLASRCADRAYVLRLGSVLAQLGGNEIAQTELMRDLYLSTRRQRN